jgi:hypothetical protein
MGSAEFRSVKAANGEMVIEMTDGGARNGKIFLYYVGSLSVKQTEGCEASIVSKEPDIHILSLANRVRTEKNTIRLTL